MAASLSMTSPRNCKETEEDDDKMKDVPALLKEVYRAHMTAVDALEVKVLELKKRCSRLERVKTELLNKGQNLQKEHDNLITEHAKVKETLAQANVRLLEPCESCRVLRGQLEQQEKLYHMVMGAIKRDDRESIDGSKINRSANDTGNNTNKTETPIAKKKEEISKVTTNLGDNSENLSQNQNQPEDGEEISPGSGKPRSLKLTRNTKRNRCKYIEETLPESKKQKCTSLESHHDSKLSRIKPPPREGKSPLKPIETQHPLSPDNTMHVLAPETCDPDVSMITADKTSYASMHPPNANFKKKGKPMEKPNIVIPETMAMDAYDSDEMEHGEEYEQEDPEKNETVKQETVIMLSPPSHASTPLPSGGQSRNQTSVRLGNSSTKLRDQLTTLANAQDDNPIDQSASTPPRHMTRCHDSTVSEPSSPVFGANKDRLQRSDITAKSIQSPSLFDEDENDKMREGQKDKAPSEDQTTPQREPPKKMLFLDLTNSQRAEERFLKALSESGKHAERDMDVSDHGDHSPSMLTGRTKVHGAANDHTPSKRSSLSPHRSKPEPSPPELSRSKSDPKYTSVDAGSGNPRKSKSDPKNSSVDSGPGNSRKSKSDTKISSVDAGPGNSRKSKSDPKNSSVDAGKGNPKEESPRVNPRKKLLNTLRNSPQGKSPGRSPGSPGSKKLVQTTLRLSGLVPKQSNRKSFQLDQDRSDASKPNKDDSGTGDEVLATSFDEDERKQLELATEASLRSYEMEYAGRGDSSSSCEITLSEPKWTSTQKPRDNVKRSDHKKEKTNRSSFREDQTGSLESNQGNRSPVFKKPLPPRKSEKTYDNRIIALKSTESFDPDATRDPATMDPFQVFDKHSSGKDDDFKNSLRNKRDHPDMNGTIDPNVHLSQYNTPAETDSETLRPETPQDCEQYLEAISIYSLETRKYENSNPTSQGSSKSKQGSQNSGSSKVKRDETKAAPQRKSSRIQNQGSQDSQDFMDVSAKSVVFGKGPSAEKLSGLGQRSRSSTKAGDVEEGENSIEEELVSRISQTHDPDDSFDRLPGKDGGPGYAYVDVVRKRDERQKLNAYACNECELYYDGLGLSEEEKAERMKNCRHRARFARPDTPEHYWSVNFPDTQEMEERGYLNTTQARPSRFRRKRGLKSLFDKDTTEDCVEES